MPQFETNFFERNAPVWSALLAKIKWDPDRPHTMIEVGSAEGSSACWFMQTMLRSPQSRLVCIDTWEGPVGEARYPRFMSNIAELEGRERIEVMRQPSHEALKALAGRGELAHMIYIDGSHTGPSVLRDLVLAFDLARVGAVICCDDYLWRNADRGGAPVNARPKIAIDAFTLIYDDKLSVIAGPPNTQVFIQKLAD